jgi:hypothetical protein
MIKSKLGSSRKEFDFAGNVDDNDPDYLFRFVFITQQFKLDNHASCPARITNLIVRMIIDAKVPLFDNEESNIMRLNQVNISHLGPPNSREDQWLAERRQYWKTECRFSIITLISLNSYSMLT